MDELLRAGYDRVPYEGQALPLAHPDHLATVATLFGMSPPAPAAARVLELGCGVGANLIALAQAMPDANFLGIDLSPGQIERGRRAVQELGLPNIQLRAQNVTDLSTSGGTFDYVICHGVFSWVPESVRQSILRICRDLLAGQGVAYVSYNVYPGRHSFAVVRELMLHHAARFESLEEKAHQARGILEFISRQVGRDGAYGAMLAEELDLLRSLPDYVLVHDHLAELNDPILFKDFAASAARFGLQFLAESQVGAMVVSLFGPEASDGLRRLARDVIDLEQYMDFLRNRRFRETLLCHAEVKLDRALRAERVRRMWVAAGLRPCAVGPAPMDQTPVTYEGPRLLAGTGTVRVTLTNPLSKAAFAALAELWPQHIAFEHLVGRAQQRLGSQTSDTPDESARSRLAADILDSFVLGIARLGVRQ